MSVTREEVSRVFAECEADKWVSLSPRFGVEIRDLAIRALDSDNAVGQDYLKGSEAETTPLKPLAGPEVSSHRPDEKPVPAAPEPGLVERLKAQFYAGEGQIQLRDECILAIESAESRVRGLDERLDREIESSIDWRKRATKAERRSSDLARGLKWAQFGLAFLEGYAREGKLLTVLAKVEEMQAELRKLI